MGGRSGQSVSGAIGGGQSTNAEINSAIERVDNLPKGKIFEDAKNIEGIFKKSEKGYSKTLETFEKNKENGKLASVNIKDISVTQPNIQSKKVNRMLKDIKKTPTINVVQFKSGEKVIFDGHHRLVSSWALGNKKIRVNLVKEQ